MIRNQVTMPAILGRWQKPVALLRAALSVDAPECRSNPTHMSLSNHLG